MQWLKKFRRSNLQINKQIHMQISNLQNDTQKNVVWSAKYRIFYDLVLVVVYFYCKLSTLWRGTLLLSQLCILHFTFCIIHFTFYILNSTFHNLETIIFFIWKVQNETICKFTIIWYNCGNLTLEYISM